MINNRNFLFERAPIQSVRDLLIIMTKLRSLIRYIFFCLSLFCLISVTCASSENPQATPEPSLYLNFNEGGSGYAFDASGNGNIGVLHDVLRAENAGCGKSVFFNGITSYGEIPFRTQNHPTEKITVSVWFLTNSFEPQVLISTYEEGGYRLGFDDGKDLWWTLNLENDREVSIPVQHESISLGTWHQVTGTYDGQKMKVYLDGILRNQMNVTGAIHYQYNNYVMLGADAGVYNQTDPNCPMYFRGGLDELRIYDTALTYGQVMEDRFACSPESGTRSGASLNTTEPLSESCTALSGSVVIGADDQTSRILSFSNRNENGTWNVTLPPGSMLIVKAHDFYSVSYPDAWYIEISDEKNGRITRSIAFPNRNNAPLKGDIPSGNATVLVRYFNGKERFPSKVSIDFESVSPPPPVAPRQTILNYPIIVIYSASWATLVAIILVIFWLHRRRKKLKT
jgi:hypothetical protein